jgi:pimeloyl-ACP methyl ester carboxylesterase
MLRPAAASLLLALVACAGAPPAPPPAAPQARAVATARGRIHVDDGGRGGLPVILLHGAGGDHAIWAAQLEHLRRSRRAVAIDLPGFGRSDPPRGDDYAPAALGEDVGRVAEALGVTRFVLVAHDFSATIAIAYAARHPLRVAGILFVDGFAGRLDPTPAVRAAEVEAHAPERLRETLRARHGPLLDGATEATRQRVLAALDAAPRAPMLGAALGQLSFSPAKELERFKGPIFALAARQLVLQGIQGNVEGVRYEKVDGTSHWIMLDRPDAVNAALDAFLVQAEGPARPAAGPHPGQRPPRAP